MDAYYQLEVAINSGDLVAVKRLVGLGFNINKRQSRMHPTYLHTAVKNNSYDIVEYLVNNGARIDAQCSIFTPLQTAIQLEIDHNLDMNQGIDANSYMNLDMNQNFEIIKLLINVDTFDSMFNRCSYGLTPLHLAAKTNKLNVVEYIVEYLRDMDETLDFYDYHSTTPLMYAVMNGQLEVAKYMIIAGADINKIDMETIKETFNDDYLQMLANFMHQ